MDGRVMGGAHGIGGEWGHIPLPAPSVEEVTAAATRLISSLEIHAPPRDREEEMRKAKERSRKRFA